jgi:2-oxo-3-hexenedioate decarboxylase
MNIEAIAAEALASLDGGRQITSFSARIPDFTLDDAYRATAAMRQTRISRGERVLGRKIGFTNRTIWAEYNVFAPIWGFVYDRTLRNLAEIGGVFPLTGLAEPRIEPEIVFGLSRAPTPGMDDRALLACIEWVAHGFELVQSIFPGWKFSPADTVAGNALHGALLIGERHPVGEGAGEWLRTLSAFDIDLKWKGRCPRCAT